MISIVIVNYNTTKFLIECLNSISKNLNKFSYEVIVVDNNSPERDIEKLPALFPHYNFYFLEMNNGFGAGCNFGAKKAKGEYLLFLNPDIRLLNNSIIKLVEFMQKSPDVGACSGILTDDEGNLSYCFNSFPSISWEIKQAFGISLKKTIEKLLSNENIKKNIPFEVDWFHGACLIVRKDIFNELGGFDESIFLYYEDVDLQKRIKEKDFKIFCIPEVKLYHATQSSVRSGSSRLLFYYNMHSAKLFYFKKHKGLTDNFLLRIIYSSAAIIKSPLIFIRKKFRGNRLKELSYNFLILKIYLSRLKTI